MKKVDILVIGDYDIALHMLKEINETTSINRDNYMSAKLAITLLDQRKYDLILVDDKIHGEDTISVVEQIRKKDRYIPIIMMISMSKDEPIKLSTLRAGATDFWDKKGSLEELKIRIHNHVSLYHQRCKKMTSYYLEREDGVNIKSEFYPEKETMDALMKLAKYKDQQTVAHTERVGAYAEIICKELGLCYEHKEHIVYGAKLHDLGKVGIPDSILNKKGKLTEEEYEILKEHTWIGFEILGKYRSEHLKIAAQIALTHHERYDGAGYPRGLKEDEIPLEGRIVAIIDTFDALVTERSYKVAWTIEAAIEYLLEMRNTQFDGMLVDLFVRRKDAILGIYNQFKA